MGVKGNVNVTGRKLTWCQKIFIAEVDLTSVQCMLNGCIIIILLIPGCLISLPLPFFAAMQAKLKLADASWQLIQPCAEGQKAWQRMLAPLLSIKRHKLRSTYCCCSVISQWCFKCMLNAVFLSIYQISKALPAACVGVNHLHTHRPWLQKTGVKAKNIKYNSVLHRVRTPRSTVKLCLWLFSNQIHNWILY